MVHGVLSGRDKSQRVDNDFSLPTQKLHSKVINLPLLQICARDLTNEQPLAREGHAA